MLDPRLKVGTGPGQQPHRRKVSLCRGPHQGGLLTNPLLGIHRSALGHEPAKHLHMAAARRDHQHRLAARTPAGFRIHARAQQGVDDSGVTVLRCQPDRRDAVPIRRRNVGACIDQSDQGFQVAMVGRPVERDRTIAAGLVHIHALREQRVDGRPVSPLGRVNQRGFARGLGRCHRPGQDGSRQCHAPARA